MLFKLLQTKLRLSTRYSFAPTPRFPLFLPRNPLYSESMPKLQSSLPMHHEKALLLIIVVIFILSTGLYLWK